MFTKFVADNSIKTITNNKLKIQNIQQKIVQKRYELKGEIVDINNKLFSHLRFTFTALGEKLYQDQFLLDEKDIFFLKISEIKQLVNQKTDHQQTISIIDKRQQKCQEYKEIKNSLPDIWQKSQN